MVLEITIMTLINYALSSQVLMLHSSEWFSYGNGPTSNELLKEIKVAIKFFKRY